MRAMILAMAVAMTVPTGAFASDPLNFVNQSNGAASGIKILTEDSGDALVVQPKIGLKPTLNEISDKLQQAQKRNLLTSVEVNSFAARSKVIAAQMTAGNHLSFQQGQQLSKDLFTLTDDINRGLRRSQQLAMYYCPDGACPTSRDQLVTEYKQLKRDMKDAVANRTLKPSDALYYNKELQHLMQTANTNPTDSQQLAYIGKRLRKLSLHVQSVAHAGTLSERPLGWNDVPLPRGL